MPREMAERARGSGGSGSLPPDFLVLGLGNPGAAYASTRHNFGFLVIEALARSRGQALEPGPGPSLVCPATIEGARGLLAEPMTWMNRSGEAARALVDRFAGPELSRILVVTDDLDLPLGIIRFRRSGGNGGHRGVRSLIEGLESRDFPRLRLGIGRPDAVDREDVVDWVLEPFGADERPVVDEVVVRATEAIEVFIDRGIEEVMNRFNAGGGRSESGPEDEATGE